MSAQDPLYPVEAEQRVIGCCLRGPEEPQEAGKEIPASEISVRAARELSVVDFYDGGPYRMAFEVLTCLIEGEPVRYSIDFQQQFHQAWRKRFPGTIVPVDVLEASNKVPTAYALPDYVAIVKAFSERRACIDRTAGAFTLMRDPSQPLESGLAELAPLLDRKTIHRDTYDGREAAQELTNYLEERFEAKGQPSGIVCGIAQLDRLLDGFQREEQTVIGARPSQGKTALATSIALEIGIQRRIPTLFVSLEMSVRSLTRRALSAWGEVPMDRLKRGTFSQTDFVKFTSFTARLTGSPLKFFDFVRGVDSTRLCAAIRQHVRQFKTELVIIDYLQKIRPAARHEKRTYEIAGVSESLAALARSTGVALVTLAQLNREPDRDSGRAPRLSDLADSSQIERDADAVVLIHRPRTEDDPHGEQASLIVAKQRDGETGIAHVRFNGEFCRFENRE